MAGKLFLREGAAYWQNRALQAEAKSEERLAVLEMLSGHLPDSFWARVEVEDYHHALSDDVVEPLCPHNWKGYACPHCKDEADQEVK